MQPGGWPEVSSEFRPLSGAGWEPPQGSASAAPAARVSPGQGTQPGCCHLRLEPATAPANAGSAGLQGGSVRDFPALFRARCWREQEALRAPGSSLLMLSPRWQGMNKLLLVNLTSRALFQEQQ